MPVLQDPRGMARATLPESQSLGVPLTPDGQNAYTPRVSLCWCLSLRHRDSPAVRSNRLRENHRLVKPGKGRTGCLNHAITYSNSAPWDRLKGESPMATEPP